MIKQTREKKLIVLTKELTKLVVTLKTLKKVSPILYEAVLANVNDGEQNDEVVN